MPGRKTGMFDKSGVVRTSNLFSVSIPNWATLDLHLFKWKENQTFSRDSSTGTQESAAPSTAPGVVEILNFKPWSAGDLSVPCWTKTQAQEGAGVASRMKK